MRAREMILVWVLLIAAMALAYADVIRELMRQWSANDTYSFGVLVPFISAYLVWTGRERLRTVEAVPSPWIGGAVVVAAAAILLLGRISAIVAFQEISLVMMIVGLVLLVFGHRFTAALWFPLSYLLLMLPIWNVLTDRMHLPFQLFSAGVGARILHAVGVPVHRQDNFLELPNITLEVASICSGVNYLIAVVAIGIPQAYIFLSGWLPRASALAFGLAVAVLGNGLRVGLIGVFAYNGWSQFLHGPAHIFQGLFVSFVGFIALLGGVSLLARRYPRIHAPVTETLPLRTGGTRRRLALAGGGGIVVLLALSSFHPEASAAALETGAIVSPPTMTSWQMEPSLVPARFVADETGRPNFANVFVNQAGNRVEYYAGNLAYGTPDVPLDYRDVSLFEALPYAMTLTAPDGTSVRVNRATVVLNDRRTEVVYWYDLDGVVTSELTMAKAYTTWQLLAGRAALPRLILMALDLDAPGAEAGVLPAFATELLAAPARWRENTAK